VEARRLPSTPPANWVFNPHPIYPPFQRFLSAAVNGGNCPERIVAVGVAVSRFHVYDVRQRSYSPHAVRFMKASPALFKPLFDGSAHFFSGHRILLLLFSMITAGRHRHLF
jgi:hypothetical protein